MSPDSQIVSTPSVLLVDDNPGNLIALAAVLKPLGARLVEATTGAEALAQVAREEFAVVLLDVQMPEMDGFEVATRIRAMDGGRELPIIFLTAIHRDDRFIKKGYASGAADYITKPFDAEIVRARVRAFVDLFEQRESVRRAHVALRTNERDDAIKKLVAFERISTAALVTSDLSAFLRELLSVFMTSADAADSVTILLREGDVLKTQACLGLNEEVDERTELRIGEGFAGKIAAEREPYELADAASSPLIQSSWLRARGTKGIYGVPLMHEGEVVGVAHIASTRASSFPLHEKRLFMALAQRAAWAVAQHVHRARVVEHERTSRRDAELASRMKDEFLATVSHELRTPLNAILGWTVSARTKNPSPEIDHALAIVERNARAQARIIDDVLDLSRIVSGKLTLEIEDLTLEAVVEPAVDAVRPAAAAKGIELQVDIDATATFRADPDRLQQILWNLLSNAIKFSDSGGRVTLTASKGESSILFHVEDRGEGIDPAFLPHVFEPFRQADASTSRRQGGLGLGLSIVNQIALAHGGRILAKSDGVGAGASFKLELPLKAVAGEPAPGRAASLPPPPAEDARGLAGIKVLVVDDEDDARLLLTDVLGERGADVSDASSAKEAFAELVRVRPDVIVSDIAMPAGDGYGFMRAVRRLPPESGGQTPAIAVTAHARSEDGERALAAGFQTYLAKPVDMLRLVAIIAKLGRKSVPDA